MPHAEKRVAAVSGAIPAIAGTAKTAIATKEAPAAQAPRAAAKRPVWIGSPHLVDMGQRLASSMINAKDFTALRQYIDDANSSDPRIRDNGFSVLAGASCCFASILVNMKNQGSVKFTGAPGARLLEAEEVLYAFQTDIGRVSGILNSQIKMLGQILPQGKWTATYRAASTVAEAAPGAKEAGPMEVKVVEMPARHSVTNIDRNMAGEITRAEQIESDL